MIRDYVADKYWPQAKKESKRVTGSKILELYGKMYTKESAPKAAASEKSEKPTVKPEEKPTESSQVKQEESKDVTMQDPDAEDGEIREDASPVKKEEMKMETLPKQEAAA